MTPEKDIARILAKLRSLEKEKAPAMVLDKCDATTLSEYVEWLEQCYESEWGTIPGPLKWRVASGS